MKIVATKEKEISVDEVISNRNEKSIIVYRSKSSTRMSVFQWCILSKIGKEGYGFIRLGYPIQSNPTYISFTLADSLKEAVRNREVHVFDTFEEFMAFVR